MKKLLSALFVLAAPVIASAQITVSTSQYTTQELVNTVLLNNACIPATNITSKTGTDFGSVNGIGYFEQNGTTFPFESGIVISTGDAAGAVGPATGSSYGSDLWGGDADMFGFGYEGYMNASVLEFNFTAQQDYISMNYLFASNEYGLYQCDFSDAFLFLLTDVTNGGTPLNIAVIPGTIIPVSTVTIRDNEFNNNCPSVNSEYFGSYLADDPAASVNFKGITVPLTSQATVVPGHVYRLKIVIADRTDTSNDSAIFLDAGSFDFGSVNDGIAINSSQGDMICLGYTTTLSVLDNNVYSYAWSKDGVSLNNTDSSIQAQEAGEYSVTITNPGTTCSITRSINITSGGGVTENLTIDNLTIYEEDTDGFGTFDLNEIVDSLIAQFTSGQDYTINFYLSLTDAELGTNPLADFMFTNTTPNQQWIVLKIENENGCFTTYDLSLNVLEAVPAPVAESIQILSEGATLADIEIEGENILWYDNDGTVPPPPTGNDTPLPLSTPIVSGVTYYASQTIDGVESQNRTPVTVTLTLDIEENIFTNLTYYPNPVNDILNISSNDIIENAVVTNMLGQEVMSKDINSTSPTINLSGLGKGVYFVKLKAGSKEKTLKIVKE